MNHEPDQESLIWEALDESMDGEEAEAVGLVRQVLKRRLEHVRLEGHPERVIAF